jgi:glycosyltransferase involved in cell wall biosynthesis
VSQLVPDLSVIIPVYNRGELIRYTLESVRRASGGLKVEVVIVDDGSDEPAADSIARLGFVPDQVIRQPNQGLLFARLTGLAAATGRYTLFSIQTTSSRRTNSGCKWRRSTPPVQP